MIGIVLGRAIETAWETDGKTIEKFFEIFDQRTSRFVVCVVLCRASEEHHTSVTGTNTKRATASPSVSQQRHEIVRKEEKTHRFVEH